MALWCWELLPTARPRRPGPCRPPALPREGRRPGSPRVQYSHLQGAAGRFTYLGSIPHNSTETERSGKLFKFSRSDPHLASQGGVFSINRKSQGQLQRDVRKCPDCFTIQARPPEGELRATAFLTGCVKNNSVSLTESEPCSHVHPLRLP